MRIYRNVQLKNIKKQGDGEKGGGEEIHEKIFNQPKDPSFFVNVTGAACLVRIAFSVWSIRNCTDSVTEREVDSEVTEL